MDTEVTITIEEKSEQESRKAAELAFQEMKILDCLYNWRNPSGNLYKLNKNKIIRSDKTLDALIKKSLEYSKLTEGAFDITIQPLIELWNIPGNKTPPDKYSIKNALKRVNYKYIKVGKKNIRLYNGARIDLGGIAKGQIVDSAIEVLRACGIKCALVNAGGNISVIGDKYWKIGIRHPRGDINKILGIIEIKNQAVATSGDYERFFEYRGKRYHHIFNPKTGLPADKCISVTVVAPNATEADALSTSLFVLGAEKGLKLANELQGIECIFVNPDGKITTTPGLKNLKLKF
ncbi:MAG: FAD:protein FMN transferase [Elusimicrobiota bacterium]